MNTILIFLQALMTITTTSLRKIKLKMSLTQLKMTCWERIWTLEIATPISRTSLLLLGQLEPCLPRSAPLLLLDPMESSVFSKILGAPMTKSYLEIVKKKPNENICGPPPRTI